MSFPAGRRKMAAGAMNINKGGGLTTFKSEVQKADRGLTWKATTTGVELKGADDVDIEIDGWQQVEEWLDDWTEFGQAMPDEDAFAGADILENTATETGKQIGYSWFVEFGTESMRQRPFFRRAINEVMFLKINDIVDEAKERGGDSEYFLNKLAQELAKSTAKWLKEKNISSDGGTLYDSVGWVDTNGSMREPGDEPG